MSLKYLVLGVVGFWANLSLAMPPMEILQSCKNSKPASEEITVKEMEGFGYNEPTDLHCKNQVDTEIDGKLYGSVECDDQAYLIIADKKISTEKAENYSTNPSIIPDTPIVQAAGWWIIKDKNKTYICIQSPLSTSGRAANYMQYYLVEDPFNTSLSTNNLYFYFFEKDKIVS